MSKVELNIKGNVTETLIDSRTLNGVFIQLKMYLLLLVLLISLFKEEKTL